MRLGSPKPEDARYYKFAWNSAQSVPPIGQMDYQPKGGAVRMRGKWYALSFDCHLTPDHMRAKDFSFTLGAPIPKSKWQDLGLW